VESLSVANQLYTRLAELNIVQKCWSNLPPKLPVFPAVSDVFFRRSISAEGQRQMPLL